jgi:hypothetical protein
LPDIVDNHPSGTTFCIHDGTHRVEDHISVQSGDTFAGVYSDATRPTVTTDSAHHVFDAGTGSGATIKDLTISGAVGDDRCEPNCGRGIRGGRNLIVLRVRLTGNVNQGIGGTLSGLVVRDSVVDNNGSRTFSAFDGGPSSTAGIKSVNSMSIIDSHIHHTWWNGVWCDELCGALEVTGSEVSDDGKAGISYAWSQDYRNKRRRTPPVRPPTEGYEWMFHAGETSQREFPSDEGGQGLLLGVRETAQQAAEGLRGRSKGPGPRRRARARRVRPRACAFRLCTPIRREDCSRWPVLPESRRCAGRRMALPVQFF